MPTISNAPMPMGGSQGLVSGWGMGNQLIQNIMNRQKMQQQAAQFEKNLALQKQQQSRLSQMMPYQIQALQDAHAKAEMETDPAKKMAYIQQIIQGVRAMRQNQQAQGGQEPQSQEPQLAFPAFQGMGMPNMQEPKQNQVAPPSMEQVIQGFSPEEQMALGMAGVKLPAIRETPEQRESREVRTTEEKEQKKIDIKTRENLKQELPKAKELMERIEAAIPMIKINKELFGPGVGGIDWLGGPQQRYRGLKDPKKIAAFKHLSNLFAQLQGQQASDFSSRSMKVAFDLAKQAKTSMEDHPEAAIQTLQDILSKMKKLHREDIKRFEQAGGKMSSQKRLVYNPVTGRLE